MLKQRDKVHYKMYKQGRAWVFAAIVTTTLTLGVAGGQTAKADTTLTADAQVDTGDQSAEPAKEVTLASSTNSDEVIPVTDAGSDTRTSQPDPSVANKPSEQPDTTAAKTTNETPPPVKYQEAVEPTTPEPTTVKKPVTKVTTAVTPDMRIQAPTRTKMKHTARMMVPAAPAVTPAVTAATPVAEADESIDQWMPNKTLQNFILSQLNRGGFDKTWGSVDEITKADMLNFTGLNLQSVSTYIDGKQMFSLEGLQYATNLTSLDLTNSINLSPAYVRGDIVDITPLASLTNLQSLQLASQRVSDVTPLAGLTKLTELNLSSDCIADFSSLNALQYTKTFNIQRQFVERPVVYIPITGKYTMENLVKAPQGMTFDYAGSKNKGIVVTPYTQPNGKVRLFYSGGSSTLNGDQIAFQVVQNQLMPGPTKSPYPNYTVMQNPYMYYLCSEFVDSNGAMVVDVFTPYLVADYAKDITIKYVDENENVLAKNDTLTGLIGESYMATPKELEGYTLIAMPDNATGTFSDKPQTVTFVYKEATSTVTVHYQDEQGATIKPDDVKTGKVGDAYAIAHPAISGYTYKETVGEANGTYLETPTEVTFIYRKGTVTPPVTPAQTITVTVHYQTADGMPVAPDVIITGKAGDVYTTSPATTVLDGYELVSTPANATGTMSDSDITVTYLYTNTGAGNQIDPEPEKPTIEPDRVTSTKPTSPAKQQPANRGRSGRVTTGQRRLADGGEAAAIDLTAEPDTKTSHQTDTNVETTLPQADEQSMSPLWGLALLGSLLGLVGLKWRKQH